MSVIDRLLHRNQSAQPNDGPTPVSAGRGAATMGMVYRPRIMRLEDRLLLNATPEAAVEDLPDDQMINEDFQFTVSFDNTSTDPNDVGYGPFVDVTVGPGIEVNNVTYLGASVQSQEIATWDGSQWVDGSGNPVTQHPLDTVGGQLALPTGSIEGEIWITVLAPFGSYTPDQPAVDLVFHATMEESPDANPETGAVPGDDILVTARGGFRFGEDALDNPDTDPPLQQGAAVSDTVTPIVMRLEKDVQLPENETAQGPNFQFTYTITVDIADGVTVTDVNVQDLLPDNLFFLNQETSIAADSVVFATGVPGIDNTITTASWTFATVTGTTADNDIVITLTAYAPEFAADGTDLDEMDDESPESYLATNNAEVVSANYEAANGDTIAIDTTNSGQLEDSVDIIVRPYTVLKTATIEGGGDAVPGKYVQYEIDIDVSDYLALEDGLLTDVLADGLTFDTTDNATLDHTPVLRVEMNGEVYLFELSLTPPLGDAVELEAVIQGDGTQQVTFYLSNAVTNAGATDPTLYGDLFDDDAEQGPTRMTLTYFALIEENYRVKANQGPVVVNDRLANTVNLTLNSQTTGNAAQPDGSGDEVVIDPPQSDKSLYAVNGVIGAPAQIAPGDEVTYRIRIDVGSADVDDLVITDYLPSPIYNVDEEGGFTFVDGQAIPAAYTVTLGPDDTLSGTAVVGNPTVSVDGASNSIIITYGSFDEEASQGGVIDLLYTIQVLDEPFADGLLLTNQAVIETANSDAVIDDDVIINDVTFHQPVLSVTKGAVATDADGAVDDSLGFNPTSVAPGKMDFEAGPGFSLAPGDIVTADDLAATPIDSDMSGFDAGDTVKFAVTVQNTGGEDAFDVVLRDTLPPGFAIPPGAVLTVQYGDGTDVSFTGDINDFFSATGIEINDDDAAGIGGIAAAGDANGHDIIIVSYELIATDPAEPIAPNTTATNTAEIVSFAALEGGTDFTEGVPGEDFTDEAAVTAQTVDLDKRLIATDQDFTDGNDLTIGETGTFQIEVTMPDGETPATVTDVLPQGMELVGDPVIRLTFTNADGVEVTFEGTVQQGGNTLSDGSELAFTQTGNAITFDFSNILTNAAPGTDLSGQSFVIEYQAIATDDPALEAGDTVNNTATLTTPTTDPVSDNAAVDIVEPDLTITKTFTPDEAQANETVGMTLEVANGTGTFDTTSFGLTLTDDDLPKDVFSDVVSVSVTGTGNVQAQIDAGLVTVDIDDSDPDNWIITVTGTPDFAIAKGEKLILNFDLTVQPNAVEGTIVDNTATVEEYSSLPGDDPDQIEREFGPTDGEDTLTISGPEIEKFLINTSLGGEPIDFPLPEELPIDTTGMDPDPNVAVGEVLTFALQVSFPRGQADNVVVFDDTDFLNALGETVGLFNIVSVDQVFVGNQLVLSTGGLTPGDAVLTDTNSDGLVNRLQFTIGQVNNNAAGDVDVLNESIFIIFRAQVMNVPETDGGDVPLNGARVTYEVEGVTQQFDDEFEITITEPAIDVAKSVTGDGPDLDAGDELTYTLTLSHDDALSTGDGYALTLTDVLPDDLEFVDGSVVVEGFTAEGFDGTPEFSFDAGTNTLTVSDFDLPQGQTVTITYRAVVSDAVVQGETLTNNVTLTYQSLPDIDPVDDLDPSIPDGIDSESQTRDGSDMIPRDQDDPVLVNNYFFETEQTVTIADPGPIVKTVDKPTATIGEIVTYTLEIPLIEGTTVGARVTDTLPPGVTFLSGTILNGDGDPIDPALFTFTQVGQTLTITANDEFITPGDNNTANDFITITYTARVDNVVDNQNNDGKPNTAIWTHDNGGSQDSASFEIVEPELVLTKTNDAPATVDAGDEITFTVSATHSSNSTADAFEFTFTDEIPEDFGDVTLVSATVNGVDVSDQIEIVGNTIQTIGGADIDIPLGATFTLVYTTVVQNTVGPSETIPNTVEGQWTSLDGDQNTGAADGERDGSDPANVNDYVASADDEIVTDNNIQLVKSAEVEQATIGETVTYTLDITVFEGTLQNVIVQDLTQPEMRIDPGSLQIVDSGFAGAAGLEIVNVSLVESNLVPGAFLLTFQLQNSADGSLVNPGDVIGDMTANDTIRVTYTAVVVNEPVNQNGEQIDNAASVQADNTVRATGAESIEIVEPVITAAKTVLTDPADIQDAGDVVQYQVVLTNTGTSDAFDVTFTDTAPADTTFTGAVTAVDGTGANVGAFTLTAGSITGTIDQIAVGGTVTITYSLTVANSAAPNETLTNAVDVRWTSTQGNNPDERTGADGNPDGDFDDDGPNDNDDNLNNYQAVDDQTVQLGAFPVAIEKTLIDSSVTQSNDVANNLTIGETATYALDVTVPEGTVQNLTVVDIVQPGLNVDATSVAIDMLGFDGAAITVVNATASVDANGVTTLTIVLDNDGAAGNQIVNPGDPAGNTDDNDTFRITYNATVINELGNQDGVAIDNEATASADDVESVSDDETISLVEPNVTIDKTVTSPSGPVDAGDVISYQVVLTNNGDADAFDVVFTDTAPANALFTGAVTALDAVGNPVGTFAITSGGTVISGDAFDIPIGGTVTITYTLTVQDTITNADQLVNQADVTWTSTPGANADERNGSDGPGPDATVLDNYAATDSATVDTDFEISIEKTLIATDVAETTGDQLTIGETATYQLDITLPEGTTNGLVVVDVTDAWMGIDLSSLTVISSGFAGGTVNITDATLNVGPLGVTTLSFQLDTTGTPGQVVNPGDPFGDTTDNDTISITYSATVLDRLGNQDGDVISNTVTVSAGNGIDPDDATETINIVEPELVIDKRAILPIVTVGGTARYEIRVDHTANSHVDAFDVVVSDPFDNPLLTLNQGSVTATVVNGSGAEILAISFVDNGFVVTLDKLELGATLVINFTAESVVTEGADGATVPNLSTLDYDSFPGSADDQRDYTDADDAQVTITGPDLQLIKDASVDIIGPGDQFTYDIQVLNVGAPGIDIPLVETARDVVFTDILPQDVDLLSVSVDGVNTSFTFDPATRVVTVTLGNIPPDEMRIITLFMQASDPFSPATSGGTGDVDLINVAEVNMRQTDPTPENNIDDATITTRGIPDLVIEKTNNVEETGGSETVPFTITARNVGDRVAADVQIIDRIDTNVFEFVSANRGGVYDAASGTVTWHLDTLSPDDGDQLFTMVLKVKPGLPASLDETTNLIDISDNGFGGRDPTPENNHDEHTDRLIYPDLVITKVSAVEEVRPGDIIDYAITVRNIGDFRADGVVVRDYVDPRFFRFVSATNGGVFDPSTNIVTWNLGTVAPGDAPITLGLTVEVQFPSDVSIDNVVNVIEVNGDGTTGQDSDPTNNIDTEIDILDAVIDPIEIAAVLGDDDEDEEEEIEPPIYIAPYFTGTAAIGATVTVTVYNAEGLPIDTGSAVVSPDGNWMLSMDDVPNGAPVSAIVMTSPPKLTSLGTLDQTNVHYSPGATTPIPFERHFDIYSAKDLEAGIVLKDQMAASEDPLAISSRRYINYNALTGTAIGEY